MRIRRMTLEDLPAVLLIEEACFTDPWTEKGFRESLNEESAHLLVLEDENVGIAGYACLYRAADEGEIVNVAVSPECRQQGYGSRVVDELMRLGKELGTERFFLEVREGNAAGRALYTGLGFSECGIRKGFYENPREDAVLMMWQEEVLSQ